jgi:hypothetical protein
MPQKQIVSGILGQELGHGGIFTIPVLERAYFPIAN